jgi:Rrf2 family protein
MKFTTKGRYALRILVDIALNSNDNYISIKEISERQGISTKYMETIVSMLNKGGFLNSLRGHAGGYKLSRPAEKIIVGDVLSYIEGTIAPIPCLDEEVNTCEKANECMTLPFWKGLDDVIKNYMYSYTIQDFIDRSKELSGDFYCI